MAKASVHIRKTRTIKRTKTTTRTRKSRNGSGNNKKGNTNRCPSCGRFL